jgi:tetratricopeptide (TPR) repeat protein|uniref:tetratricopeptide repeat protein n=1 Tax=Nitrospira cf. moscoviensis SBR1015 TaxID=96242 RepID=UPI000B3BCF62|nr:tetratricopeptide repeat protein [Nitrospira cf. moscoviensis SBR1015]
MQHMSPLIASLMLVLVVAARGIGYAEVSANISDAHVIEQVKIVWESGAVTSALELLDQGIQSHPRSALLHKLRGDILATFRGLQEAVQAYETALTAEPSALETRWAKWSLLVRWGQNDDAIAELRRIAGLDPTNPLAHLKLAQELRKLDRLEESLESYQEAVRLRPDLLGWRLALARAQFDVLDYQGAETGVRAVLEQLTPGSPLEIPAKNQLAQLYESMERGRRFTPALTAGATEAQLREWAAIRAEAWKLFAAGRYQEAEPVYRQMLALNPRDALATHQLGVTLMQLGRCKDALSVFGKMSDLDPSEEDYADTTFRMGQCLVELEQWEDAFVHFQMLYDAAVEFEESNKNVILPAGTRVLSKEKLARWLDKVRPHVPELAAVKDEAAENSNGGPGQVVSKELPVEEVYAKATERVKPQKAMDQAATLVGRDADFSWFRFVIPAGAVMRDDFPTGAHEYIPLNPSDTFSTMQHEIYLVFGLVSDSFDAVPLTARCVVESSDMAEKSRVAAQDHVLTSMSDRSGYFMLTPPTAGWTPGLYRCGLFAGEYASAYTQVDEVRFRIVEPGE